MRATVIGGGIGGLATALALQRGGWRVEVLERAPAPDRGGAGLVLWPNALRCLRVLGVEDAVRARATVLSGSVLRRTDGRPLSTIVLEGGPLGVVRSDLVDALASALGAGAITFGTEVADVAGLEADLVVGADGVRSVVRSSMGCGVRPVFRGYTVWRALVPRDLAGARELSETWGAGLRFGTVPVGRDRTYVYAAAPAPEGERSGDERAELVRRFEDWHAPIPALLDAIGPDALIRHDIHDLPPGATPLHRGRYVLIGDAGHAMEPNLGQGAGLALEDAVVLADALERRPTTALVDYATARNPRVIALSRQSRQIGRLARIGGPTGVAMRDLAMRSTPSRITRRAMSAATDWSPPTPQENR